MTLGQKQRAFAQCVGLLITKAYNMGFEVTLGDAYRDPRVYGEWGEKDKSLHKLRLAIDLNLFQDGRYLRSTDAHRPLGEYWERLGQRKGLPLRWGGRFNDGNHYSFEHRGCQ